MIIKFPFYARQIELLGQSESPYVTITGTDAGTDETYRPPQLLYRHVHLDNPHQSMLAPVRCFIKISKKEFMNYKILKSY